MSKLLKAAIEANDEGAVRKALSKVKDINRKMAGAGKPLLYASKVGADRVLGALFDAGAVAEKRNTFPGDTPFAVAAQHRQFAVMKQLLELHQASDEAIQHVVQDACISGKVEVLDFVLEAVKPQITIELFRLCFVPGNAPEMLKLLVKHRADVRARHNTAEAKQVTPLHEAAGHGKPEVIEALVECGAEVNAQDSLGRTPLMALGSSLEAIDVENERVPYVRELLAKGEATLLSGEPPKSLDAVGEIKTLLRLGADASLRDNFGNDASDYCAFESHRSRTTAPSEYLRLLRDAGATGSEPTLKLFTAFRDKDVAAVRAAIAAGADVNRVTPPPVQSTPLIWASGGDSEETVSTLLEAGADPNRSDTRLTPLIYAARCGNLAIVKRLLAAGADLHAIESNSEYPNNAYSAAVRNRKYEVADYLKSLGAGHPKPAKTEALKPGVGSWNDFSEVLVKAPATEAAEALARMLGGTAEPNAYGETFVPGKKAYVVARPKGMAWSNVFQIAPPPLRFEDEEKTEAFASSLAKAAGVPVLCIEYSDTSDAASILRIDPDGKQSREQGWDRLMLEEMIGALGDEAPGWAKMRLAKTPEDEPSSTERLVMLAEQEKFVVASFGLDWEPGRKLDVEFPIYGPEAFDGVAYASD